MYEEIFELINKGEINKAQEQIEKISDDDPKKYNLKGLIHFNKKELEKAKEQFEKGLTINPVDPDLLFNYGYLLKEMNQEMEAWRYLMRIHDKDWATYDLLGDIEFKNRSKLASLRFYLKAAQQTDNPQMKKKFLEIRNKIKKDTKIAFLCLPGLDNFLKDIVETFSLGYDVKLVVSTDANEITQAIKWADIVWLEWANDLAIFATNKVPEIANKKVICRLHGYEAFNVNVLKKINWNFIDRMIFVADHVREDAYESCPQIKNVPYTMVYNGINLDKFVFNKRAKGKRICFSGHVNYKKNPMLIIQILEKLLKIDGEYRIDWIGDHQDIRIRKYLNYILKDMKIEDKFTFHDWTNDINSWLEDKNYFLSTSIHEGYGVAIMEAMARGIKPIIHNFYAARGFYPDELIYNTIDEAVEKITEESYYSESYRRFIEDNYTLEEQINALETALNTLEKVNKKINKKVAEDLKDSFLDYMIPKFIEFTPYTDKYIDSFDFEGSKIRIGKVEKITDEISLIEFIVKNKKGQQLALQNIWYNHSTKQITFPNYISLSKNKKIIQNFVYQILESRLSYIGNMFRFPGSKKYWEERYKTGGNSGHGSYGKLAEFKAEVINSFVKEKRIKSIVELGCGDGNQVSLFDFPKYTGLDVSETAVNLCRERFMKDKTKSFFLYNPEEVESNKSLFKAELSLSLDVIYHLVEDLQFDLYMKNLFLSAEKFVIVYSSNTDKNPEGTPPHIKYRRFTDWIEKNSPEWELFRKIKNKYPQESLSDFFIFCRRQKGLNNH
ncbi:glycosyltransferase [Petrotoga sp. SL27]|uniref:glycosyltransferase n=1 Tax=Petrotoga sp. SL27 TaxID=1445612 RepID=UPI0013049941|nr:glycosyltransferase [Petrotoga sp. SL27]